MKKYNPTLKTEMDWSNWEQWEIPFGLNGLSVVQYVNDPDKVEMTQAFSSTGQAELFSA